MITGVSPPRSQRGSYDHCGLRMPQRRRAIRGRAQPELVDALGLTEDEAGTAVGEADDAVGEADVGEGEADGEGDAEADGEGEGEAEGEGDAEGEADLLGDADGDADPLAAVEPDAGPDAGELAIADGGAEGVKNADVAVPCSADGVMRSEFAEGAPGCPAEEEPENTDGDELVTMGA